MQGTRTPDQSAETAESLADLSATAWPGERQPTRYDVDEATEVPESTFIDRFAVALLHAEHCNDQEDVSWITEDYANEQPVNATLCTYPMIMFSNASTLPDEDEIDRLASNFDVTWQQHIYLESIKAGWTPTSLSPPYLRLALACLTALVESRTDVSVPSSPVAGHLFDGGASLVIVMVEVDNRLARSSDTILANTLLCTYGCLSPFPRQWKRSLGLLCNVTTMSRRLHLTDYRSTIWQANGDPRKQVRQDSSLISYMLLLDVVQAIHFETLPNYATQEIFIDMPGSHHPFRKSYESLLHGSALPKDMTTSQDALLLLTGILNDMLRAQKTGSLPKAVQELLKDQDPYAPMTVKWETFRIETVLESALTRWRSHFTNLPHDVLALYHFARLHLIYPQISNLARLAGYPNGKVPVRSRTTAPVPDEASGLPWKVLEQSEACTTGSESFISIWLPSIVFLSALTIAAQAEEKERTKTGIARARMLAVFANELQRLKWPCCTAMIDTLYSLMNP